jgi:DNA polymerase elongation subunit (family B)
MEYLQISLDDLKISVNNDGEILWVGSGTGYSVLIRLKTSTDDKIYSLDLNKLPKLRNPEVIQHNESTTRPLEFVGLTWQRSGWSKSIRVASMYGINVGCKCEPGLETVPTINEKECVMGYDIETSMHLVRRGGFTPSYSRIVSIAIWCSCGYCKAWTTTRHKLGKELSYCSTTSKLVEESLLDIMTHMPQWLVGYNCYNFDNCALLMHSPKGMRHLFRSVNGGSKSASRHSFFLDLPGINNVDLYSYLDKKMRGKYKALGLGSIAKFHNIEGKTQMPVDDDSNIHELISYNINDSKITSILWKVTGTHASVINLCAVSCAPVVDCVRYITGTMASCMISSYCISKNMIMDWSECNLRIGYEGGTVLEPIKQVFKNVTVCDFSSMYPSIIRDIRISPENITVLSLCSGIHSDKLLWWNNSCALLCIKGKIVKYSLLADCMAKKVLDYGVELRNKYKIKNPDYATALKGIHNSIYGAYGFASSPIHSPRCAASITVIGRTALALAVTTFNNCGLTVVYGDTDSCFLAAGSKTPLYKGGLEEHIKTAVHCFHKILSFTPFPNMRMEIDKEYKAILLVDKKHYAYKDFDGKVKTKGLSETRKDRIGLCRDITSFIAEQVLSDRSFEDIESYVSNAVGICYKSITLGELDMYSVSKEVRYEGNTCYRYKNVYGNDTNVPVTEAELYSTVEYSVEKIIEWFEKDVNRLCVPAGLGTLKSMLSNITW